jgi:hypothetical protein
VLRHVHFDGVVHQRTFNLIEGGSNSVPKTPGPAIGFDWDVIREQWGILIDDFSNKKRYPSFSFRVAEKLVPMPASVRKQRVRLKGEQGRLSIDMKQDPSDTTSEAFIRTSRERNFCTCVTGAQCTVENNCPCALEGGNCHVEHPANHCQCHKAPPCANENGCYVFDPHEVRQARQNVLRQLERETRRRMSVD